MVGVTVLSALEISVRAAVSRAGEDLIAVDVSSVFPYADIFLLVTGSSERNVSAIADGIEEELSHAGVKFHRREGHGQGRWELIDFNGLVVHVLHHEDRMFYGLERLWADCPSIPIDEFLMSKVGVVN